MIKVLLSIFLFVSMIFCTQKLAGQDIETIIPSLTELEGWKFTTEPQVFIGDNLFSLIDGGADLYLEYGFTKVVSAQYADPSLNSIQVEIYEMIDASSAYGIFSITQQALKWSKLYGNLSTVNQDYISFWKGKYYVILSWSSKQNLDEPKMDRLANLIGQNITDEGDYPDLMKSFQDEEMDSKGIYLKGNLALSNFYYFDYRDIFKIQEALAYSPGNYKRIIIKYPDQEKAIENLTGARQSMSNNKRFADVATAFQGFSCRDNKGNLILIRQIKNYSVILVDLDNSVSLESLMDEITQKIENIPR